MIGADRPATPFRLHLRRRALVVGGLLSVVVIALHLGVRGDGWRYEWTWAMHQYAFTVIFLGPIAAAVGAFEGSRWADVPESASVRSSRWRLGGRVMAAAFTSVALPYTAGLVVVLVVSWVAGNPGGPSLVQVGPVVAGYAFIAGHAGIGAAVGLATGSGLAAPLLGLGLFCFGVVAYGMPGYLTDVGQATGSLIGLQVRPGVTITQILFWSAVAMIGVAALGKPRHRALPVVCAGVGVAVTMVVVQVGIDDKLESSPVGVVCEPAGASGATICLGPGYEQFRDDVEASIAPAVGWVRATGHAEPLVFTQLGSDVFESGAGFVDGEMLDGSVQRGSVAVANALIPATCDLWADGTARDAFFSIGREFESGAPDLARLGEAIEVLTACDTSMLPPS
ncbi:MAG: hypothetical protein KF906_10970 [Actinobacteria bacterium]|nr:hypothetical protein [Actinomycetota bacterium]